MAETRADWAEDRTILANERAFSSWIGTDMQALATLFLVAAIAVFWVACEQAKQVQRRLNQRDANVPPTRAITALA